MALLYSAAIVGCQNMVTWYISLPSHRIIIWAQSLNVGVFYINAKYQDEPLNCSMFNSWVLSKQGMTTNLPPTLQTL